MLGRSFASGSRCAAKETKPCVNAVKWRTEPNSSKVGK
jgi:hypothetical protein